MNLRPTRPVTWLTAPLTAALLVSACQPTATPVAIATLIAVSSTPVTPVTAVPSVTSTLTQTPEPTETDTPTRVPSATPKPSGTPSPTQPNGTQTVVPTVSAQAARDALIAAFKKLATAYPFRLSEESSGGLGANRITDYAAADRTHTVFVVSPIQGLTEEIRIGSTVYYLYDGAWTKDIPTRPSGSQLNLGQLLIAGLQSVTDAGQDTVVGVPCFVYGFHITIPFGDQTLTGVGKAWVGIADGLPHQIDATNTVSGLSGTSHLVYSYGVQFDIQPPIQ